MRVGVFVFCLFILFSLPFQKASAELAGSESASMSATLSATPAIDYDLAYPGLLPDHPLYFFKVIRDKMVSVLINDPLKRAKFNLLTSDKRFNGGLYLVDEKKYPEAIDTFSKSNNYLHDSIVALEKAKGMNLDIVPIRDDTRKALDKRFEIAKGLEKDIPKEYQQDLRDEVNRMKLLMNRLNSL